MSFDDLFPFKDLPAEENFEHERARSVEVTAKDVRTAAAPPRFAGNRAIHRLAFRSTEIPGFPEELQVGATRIAQTEGPIWTQVTSIRQEPGWRPRFVKSMTHVPVGGGTFLTVLQTDVSVPDDLMRAMETWRDRALCHRGINRSRTR